MAWVHIPAGWQQLFSHLNALYVEWYLWLHFHSFNVLYCCELFCTAINWKFQDWTIMNCQAIMNWVAWNLTIFIWFTALNYWTKLKLTCLLHYTALYYFSVLNWIMWLHWTTFVYTSKFQCTSLHCPANPCFNILWTQLHWTGSQHYVIVLNHTTLHCFNALIYGSIKQN